jgi:hypothetical protein
MKLIIIKGRIITKAKPSMAPLSIGPVPSSIGNNMVTKMTNNKSKKATKSRRTRRSSKTAKTAKASKEDKAAKAAPCFFQRLFQ